ncbi:YfhO family protein [bacterium]|nr:YfhO family protein [bacterium]
MNIRDRLRSPLLALAVLLLAPFAPILLFPGGRVLGNEWGDNPAMFYYINEFAGRCWREGVIPLWNPHVMLGVPFLGEGQAAIFHPLSTLFVFLPTGVAINWLAALSFVLTGLFFHGWLRALKLSKAAACFGALIWCYSNVIVVRIYAGHLSILLTLIEMPLILMLWERWRASRRIAFLAGIPFAYGFMIAAGYPQLLYTFSLFFLVYVLIGSALACASKSSARREGIDILLLGVCIVLGAGIGAVQLLPSADYAAQSMRQNPSLEFSGTFSFIPGNIVTILAPRFFGYGSDPALTEYYWRSGNYWEMTLYIGMLPLMLIVPGLMAAPRRRAIVFGSCAALFSLIALGRFTPLFPIIFDYVPGFKLFRGPSKYILVTEFCLVTLAAFGLDGILKELETGARKLLKIGLASGAVLLVCLAFLYVHNIVGALEPESNWIQLMRRSLRHGLDLPDMGIIANLVGWAARELARSAVMCVLALAALACAWKIRSRRLLVSILLPVLLLDLLTVFVPLLRTYDEKIVAIPGKLVKAVKPAVYPPRVFCPGWLCNSVIHHGLSSPSGYTGNTLARYNTFVNQMKGRPFDTPELEDPIPFYIPGLEFLSAEAEFLPTARLDPSVSSTGQFQDGTKSFIPLPMSHPRAWLAASPVSVDVADRARDYVLNPKNDLRNHAVIESSSAGLQSKPLAPGEAVAFVSFNPTRVELQTTATQPRVLVLSEMYERNWTATVNGAPAEVFPANYLLRGVKVPAGPSRVVFEYRPKSFRAGAMISLASIALLIGLVSFASARKLALPEPVTEPAPQPAPIAPPRPRKKRRSH